VETELGKITEQATKPYKRFKTADNAELKVQSPEQPNNENDEETGNIYKDSKTTSQ